MLFFKKNNILCVTVETGLSNAGKISSISIEKQHDAVVKAWVWKPDKTG